MYKKFQIGFLVRVILLTLALAFLMYLLIIEKQYLRSIYLIIFIIYLIWSIYRYISKISRDFYTFISALANEEYSIQFADEKSSKNLQMLYHLYNTTANRFQKIKYERDLQHVFLEEIMNQIEVGIIAYDKNEKVLLINQAYRDLFKCRKPQILSDLNSGIYNTLIEIKPGNRKLISQTIDGEKLILSAHSTSFVLKEKSMTLVYFHNIKSEMDEQELESWQKLFSVLTHEIMNSVTPISSLSSSLNSKLKRDIVENGMADSNTLSLLSEGLDAVSNRTKGLLAFTESFRKLSKVPKPKTIEIELEKLFERIKTLFSSTFQANGITFTYLISSETSIIFADPQQIEQVFINLVQNAIDSLINKQNGLITIKSSLTSDKRTEIIVSDNGIGISEETLEKVFIPFFTTKEKGSGIGLSLSRQILRMHSGTIEIRSIKDEGTSVIVKI
ncbi:MAG: PAS domain-containing sensor histidine kinase [Tenuifilaceae bacterium]